MERQPYDQSMEKIRENLIRRLHDPERLNHLLSVEDHVVRTSNLARCLWLLTWQGRNDIWTDKRDFEAVQELIVSIADHASAAVYVLFHNELEKNRQDTVGEESHRL